MNEAAIKRKIVKHFNTCIPAACVLSHQDIKTAGIPDLSITYDGTSWVEVKYLRPEWTKSEIRRDFTAVQLARCRWLEARGACDYLVAHGPARALGGAIVSPRLVAEWLRQGDGEAQGLYLRAKFRGSLEQVLDWYIVKLRQEVIR